MKILHTSDWHLGHSLYNYDRGEEQRAMLSQMVDIVRSEMPDLFLLCGDVYDTAQPSAAVQTMFTDALVDIRKANPQMIIVIVAGNHDSGTKHEIFRTPWRVMDVHTIGTLDKESMEEHIVEVSGKGYVLAIPYTHERNIPEGFFQNLLNLVDERNSSGLPVIMAAHTTVKGCDFTGHSHRTEYCVGGIDSSDLEQMGEGYDYLALGHIHREQFVHSERHNVRYSGTPIPVSFDENYPHSVSIVELERHGDTPKVRRVEIENPRPLVSLPVDGQATWDEAKRLLQNFPSDIPAYIRLNVEFDGFLPVEANSEAAALTEGKECRFCYINSKRKTPCEYEARVLTVQEFQEEAPINIARRYADDIGVTFEGELEEMFTEVVKMLEAEPSND